MKLGIAGLGVVGGTLEEALKGYGHQVFRDDPPKGLNDDLSQCEAIFICVPVPVAKAGGQDVNAIKDVLKRYKHLDRVPFFIRSTVLPKTCDNLAKMFRMQIHSMPEFLTARNALETFGYQDIIVGCQDDPTAMEVQNEFLKKVFPDKLIFQMSNREAELAKYAHNCMGAVKVTFFNLIKKYCQKIGANYKSVADGVRMSGYINNEHMTVPGPDGKHGYGGSCFPQNMDIFISEVNRLGLQPGVLECARFENVLNRLAFDQDFKRPEIHYPVDLKKLASQT
jgi:UDPglucose 6-dehydrogenase